MKKKASAYPTLMITNRVVLQQRHTAFRPCCFQNVLPNDHQSSDLKTISDDQMLLAQGGLSSVSPYQLHYQVQQRFLGGGQQDCHELLTMLMDTLSEDLNRVTGRKVFREVSPQTL